MITVEHTDFVSVPVTDLERSTKWYAETLGLPQTGFGAWPEFKLGDNVFLYLLDPTNIGQQFEGPHTSAIALRVPDVAEAKRALEDNGVQFVSAELTMLPSTEVPLDRDKAESVLRLVEALEDLEDVQNVYSNFDIPEQVLAETG